MKKPSPICLVVIDGYGLSNNPEGNAIMNAQKPTMDRLMRNYPWVSLNAAEQYVGLSFGEMGNSEVGHLNIGAGKVVYQNLPRINLAISDKSFFENKVLLDAIAHAKKNGSALHLLGMCSNGGVHSHIDHLYALLELCQQQKMEKVYLHIITDGRDTAPAIANRFVTELQAKMKETGVGAIATIGGRYYAMDRNNVWDRTQKMYQAMTKGEGERTDDALEYLEKSYKEKVTDEMIVPAVVMKKGEPVSRVHEGDAVVFFNYRPDRARQLTQAFVKDGFSGFDRGVALKKLFFATMMQYEKGLVDTVVFPPELIEWPLARVVAEKGLKQYHIAETEKYAHVTYFLNGGLEEPFKGEDRELVPSPSVATYDLSPEMSATSVTDTLIAAIQKGAHQLYAVNYANPDMVGHTGNYDATVRAVQAVDEQIGRLCDAMLAIGGKVIITADHGNAEGLINYVTGEIDKEHSAEPVPLMLIDDDRKREKTEEEHMMAQQNISPVGLLADVAPTVLELFGLPQPKEMTGKSLLQYLV